MMIFIIFFVYSKKKRKKKENIFFIVSFGFKIQIKISKNKIANKFNKKQIKTITIFFENVPSSSEEDDESSELSEL